MFETRAIPKGLAPLVLTFAAMSYVSRLPGIVFGFTSICYFERSVDALRLWFHFGTASVWRQLHPCSEAQKDPPENGGSCVHTATHRNVLLENGR